MKTAIVVLADPNNGEEALGRVFNALAAALDLHQRGEEVKVLFQGAGTRWTGALTRPDHPAHGLFQSVRSLVEGASCGCAEVFGARQSAEAGGFPLLTDLQLPGVGGVTSLGGLARQGYTLVTF
jgi:hypothetical protein